jgi:methionine aminotransferase
MSALAKEHGAINLGQGFPGFAMDPKLIDLVNRFMLEGHNQYAPMPGIPELRNRISDKMAGLYGKKYDPEREITVTAGGTQAIYTAITSLIHQGDEVILFAPAYDCYAPAVEINGGIVKWVILDYPGYRVDWSVVKKLITSRTRMIVINTPHNPSGTCLSREDMQQLERIVVETGITVLSDEVYEHIIFDNTTHQSVASYPGLAENSLLVYSFGKTFHNTGWKMGYAVAPASLMEEFRKVHQFNVFSCNTPVQYALAEYMGDSSTWGSLASFYQRKRDQFLSLISSSRFGIVPCSGTYFQLLDYSALSDEKDTAYAVRLTIENGITTIPCSVFYPKTEQQNDKVLRICFAKESNLLEKAAAILCNI